MAKKADPDLTWVVPADTGELRQMPEADVDAAIDAGTVVRRATEQDLALGL